MRVDLLDYELDVSRIAQAPERDPEDAQLVVLPSDGEPVYHHVRDLPELVVPGSLVVVNDTRVLHARLLGTKRGSGGKAELLLVRRAQAISPQVERWWALGRASKGLRPGAVMEWGGLEAEIVEKQDERLLVELRASEGDVAEAIEKTGHVPLPPYIRRGDDQGDKVRYQTIFAQKPGAAAAPTAGLHMTESIVERLAERGSRVVPVTLHVGLGTFQPVSVEDLDQHAMHAEVFDIPASTATAIDDARRRGAPVVAIGTTVVRTLESAADASRPGHVIARSGETRLLIQPGYRFQVVDSLFTNFHLPRSTLLALVAAFAGTARILSAYADAQRHGCRFFSYGDAMLLSPCAEARREGSS